MDAFIITLSGVGLPQNVEIGDNIVRESNAVENLVPKELVIIPPLPTLLHPLNPLIMPTKNFSFKTTTSPSPPPISHTTRPTSHI